MKQLRSKSTALLLIDVINDFEFEDGPELFKSALPAAETLSALKREVKKRGVPAIYVNDNFTRWHDDFQATIRNAKRSDRGRKVVKLLRPDKDDYFVLKPKHSAFYSTVLNMMLDDLNIKNLVIGGVTSDICVLLTANDAYMRDFRVIIPSDCVAAVKPEQHLQALEYMERVLKADVKPAKDVIAALSG